MLSAAAGSGVGNRYQANFDAFSLSSDPLLAVVADGMGDGPGSAMAGRTAVDLVVERARGRKEGLVEAVAEAHRLVFDFGRDNGVLAGCTVTALAECPDGFWLAQIGDSRLYRWRGGLLELLTTDHTMAWLGAVHGWYPFDSAEARAARYHLTRFVGHFEAPEPDLLRVGVRSGDVLLLCTDGVAEQVPYRRLAEVLGSDAPAEDAVRALLDDAEAAGGRDNATAIVVRSA
ncbi:PP2C family protein-serine/threonine phosphatase [Saccharothrix yanglingensis]|uniref:PP2C family protein-serine/threonine phosphatase n=1 Tax=Saccharothrix yanglingensis TaxID=659496 RepID=UPI0027D33036|nr:protein phosphatase 2C domain-containing protein [Saccharothrix yanglingensis]